MESEMTVRAGTAADIGELSALLAEAFVLNPVAAWLVANVENRYPTFLRTFEVELEQGLAHGIVRVAGNREGVAIWQPYPMMLSTVTAHEREYLGAVGIYRRRFAHLWAARDEHRAAALRLPAGPDDQVFGPGQTLGHELVCMAAAPWLRRKRIATALLADHHGRLDAAGLAGHAVTDEEYVRDLLVRRGWRTPGPRHLSPAGPPLWSLRRDASAGPAGQAGSAGRGGRAGAGGSGATAAAGPGR
ncbi:hypothetical protein [Micromonospora sp. NBC_01813]|uniref:hypothetical protein n=1 Tax=Micromonospora sp. NBC_01813 TaxID=2975988 RepID=UPI002DDA9402|nr:hypothetical protein [Micromonospora sp. NBC_01813]WSA10267.1 hypothetical protein OG958_05580 [Micromonospora sp. NBC_01813]